MVLGDTGRNFAAGMSGGIAYVYDPAGNFASKCNMDMVKLEPVLTAAEQDKQVERAMWHSELRGEQGVEDETLLKSLIERHAKYTGSERAQVILKDWDNSRKLFVKVFPDEYRRALREINAAASVAA